MRSSKKTAIVVCFVILLSLTAVFGAFATAESYSWYCVHRKDHKQPMADSRFSFIDKYGCYYIDKAHGDGNNDKVIYLTFDVGYENGNVAKVLDVLKEEDVMGAFFILGNVVEKNTDIVKRMFDEGHLVCNHTYSHKAMVGKSREEFNREIERLESCCYERTGGKIAKYYRPPEGRFDRDSLLFAKEMGYKTVFWSFGYADWDNSAQPSVENAKRKILDNIHNGEIMLLHPTSSTNAAILSEIICELKAQGFRFGSLDELGGGCQ